MGKIFNRGLSEDDKNEGLLKRLKNIEDKNEEKLKLFSDASNVNKTSTHRENESDYNYDNNFAFYKFYRDFQNFKDRSLVSSLSTMI